MTDHDIETTSTTNLPSQQFARAYEQPRRLGGEIVRSVDFTTIHSDLCYRIKRLEDALLHTSSFKLFCGPNITIVVPLQSAAMLLSAVPGLDKLAENDVKDFSPLLPITWQWVKSEVTTNGRQLVERQLCSVSYVEPVPWYEEPEKWSRFVVRCNAGEDYIESVLGSNKSLWPGEADSLSLVKRQQAKDYVAGNPKRFGKPDPLIEEFKAKGAEVEIEDTPPKGGNGGKSNMTTEELKRDEFGNPVQEHSTTDPDKMVFAIPNYIRRELGINTPSAGKHVIALFHGPLEASKIRENGTAATWRMVEQYVARFKTKEQDDMTKNKPAATEESTAPVRPTTEEIDAARKRISDMGIKTAEDFKAATNYDNIPAAIEAGELLKSLEDRCWMWAIENDKKQPAESATKAADLGVASVAELLTPATANEPQAQGKSPMENEKTIEIDKSEFRKQRTIKVQGRDYLKAGDRVIMFRSDHPDWTLETDAVQLLPDFAVFKAFIKDNTGKLLATAHGFCTPDLAQKVSGRFVEKAETAAIARALALVGYGTDDTLDDSDYISDSPIERKAA